MAIALATWSWVRMSFRVSDVREDVLLSDVAFQRVCGLLKRTIRPFWASPPVWKSCSIASAVASVGGRSLEPLRRLATVRSCPLSAASAALRSVRFTRTLTPPFQPFLFVLILNGSPFKSCSRSPNFIPDAAHPFLLLCHSENQVRGDTAVAFAACMARSRA